MSDEVFNHIPEKHHQQTLLRCPLCGSPAEMWERIGPADIVTKAVMCTRGDSEPLGPMEDGCPFFMPPVRSFYRSTYREAAAVWNDAAKAAADARVQAAFDRPYERATT